MGFWSAGSISYGRLNLSANGDLGTQNKAEGFILGADINYGDKSLFGISLRYEDDQTNIGDDGTSFDLGQVICLYIILGKDLKKII